MTHKHSIEGLKIRCLDHGEYYGTVANGVCPECRSKVAIITLADDDAAVVDFVREGARKFEREEDVLFAKLKAMAEGKENG